jgi:hypothetical protein
MKKPATVRGVESLGRTRLSKNFFLREFLYSEITNIHGIPNLPDNPGLAIATGRELCEELLEPLQATFGRIALRSGYRSPAVNEFGNANDLSCASNKADRGRHIWDQRNDEGMAGAMVTIVVPWLVDHISAPTRWQSMAWWIHDHLPYSELQFFPKLSAFNIAWREKPLKRISSYVHPRGVLTRSGAENQNGLHDDAYPGFPDLVTVDRLYPRTNFRGI